MRLINSLLSKVYRKMQIAYDESRYYNIGALEHLTKPDK